MYLKKAKMKNGRVYLSIAEGNYNPATKQARTINIQKIGYVDELMAEYPDPIAHFTAVVEEMNRKKAAEKTILNITANGTERVIGNERKNFGYVVLSSVYHGLGIDHFMSGRQQSLKSEFNLNSIMRLLVFSRLLSPASKKKTFDERDWFFERSDFTLSDVYRALGKFSDFREALQLWIHESIVAKNGRDTTITYYDVTNYYFEIDEQDELRRKGVSKEHRPDPIVQMGLFMDNNGIPVSYQLFPGNTNDCMTLLPILKKIRKQYGTGKAVVVADKGMNTQKNAYYLANSRGGYVFSQTVRGGSKELKAYVLDETGYEIYGDDYKKKSRQFTRKVEFTDDDGNLVRAEIAEKQVVFYSRDYDLRAKADRANAVDKAKQIIKNPKNFNKYNTYGAAKYVRHIEFDKNTGEIINTGSSLSFNDDVLKEEEKYDGYYTIVTSRHFESDEWVINTYKGLWKIEESFRVTKSDLEARPIYLSREDHIQAHFLICFVSLVIARLIEQKLGNAFSIGKILNSLSKSCCSTVSDNVFMFDYHDEVLEAIGGQFNIDFAKKFRPRAEIKNIVANSKTA